MISLLLLALPAMAGLDGLFERLQSIPVPAVEGDACQGLRVDELARRCAAQAGSGRVRVSRTRRQNCRRYQLSVARKVLARHTVKQTLSAFYEIGVKDGRPTIHQTVRFTGLESAGLADARAMFRAVMEALEPDLREFFARQGLGYELAWSLAGEDPEPAVEHSEVRLLPWPCRSGPDKWCLMGIEKTREDGSAWFLRPLDPADPGKFAPLAIHELSHLLGFPDAYVDETHYCRSLYGRNGAHAAINPYVPCTSDLASYWTCPDIMAEMPERMRVRAGDGDAWGYAKKYVYRPSDVARLLEPLCPQLCSAGPIASSP